MLRSTSSFSNKIISLFLVIVGSLMVVYGVKSANTTGYDKGYADAKAAYDVPVIRADPTPIKVRPPTVINKQSCPPTFFIQEPPEKIILDKTE